MRIKDDHPQLPGVSRQASCQVTINGRSYKAYIGETIAALLLATGHLPSPAASSKQPGLAGYFCGIGHCYGCQVTIDGRLERACATAARDGMIVSTSMEP